MKVYEVTRTWVNWDGWEISGPETMATFTDKERAKHYMFNETGDHKALEYGYAVEDRHTWRIRTIEVTE